MGSPEVSQGVNQPNEEGEMRVPTVHRLYGKDNEENRARTI